MDQLGLEIAVDLFAEEIYVNIYHIGLGVKINVPDPQGDIGPGNNAILISDEVLE